MGFPERDFGTSAAVMGKPACKDEISYSGRNDMLSEVLARSDSKLFLPLIYISFSSSFELSVYIEII